MFDVFLRLFMLEQGQVRKMRHKRALQLYNKRTTSDISPELMEYMERYFNEPESTGTEERLKQQKLLDKYGDHVKIGNKRYLIPVLVSLILHSRVACAVLLGAASAWMQAAMDTTLPLHLYHLFGYNSLQSGIVFLALAVPCLLQPLFGKLADKINPKYMISGGYFLFIAPLVCLRIPRHDTINDKVSFIALVGIYGLMMAAVVPPTMAESHGL